MATLKSVYLLWGDDAGAIQAAVEKIRNAVLGPDGGGAMAAFNHERFDAPYVKSVREVLSACAQVPMMAERRLVEVSAPEDFGRHVQGDGSKDQAIDALIGYLEDPSPSTVLVLSSAGLKGTSKLVKAAKKAPAAHEAKMSVPRDRDAVQALGDLARERGIRLARGPAAAIVEAVGASRASMTAALERAHAHAGKDTVTMEDVRAVVATTREADIFALTDAVGRGDHRAALVTLSAMFASGERDTSTAMRVYSMLVWQIRRLFVVKVADDPVRALGIKPFAVDKLRQQVARFDEDRLRRAHEGLAKLDEDFKGGSRLAYLNPYVVLQRWILDVCGAMPGT